MFFVLRLVNALAKFFDCLRLVFYGLLEVARFSVGSGKRIDDFVIFPVAQLTCLPPEIDCALPITVASFRACG